MRRTGPVTKVRPRKYAMPAAQLVATNRVRFPLADLADHAQPTSPDVDWLWPEAVRSSEAELGEPS